MSTQPNLNRAMQRKARKIARERGVPYQTVLRELEALEVRPPEMTAQTLRLIEGLDHVRHRPGMYIGGTGKGPMHSLLWEVLDSSLEQYRYGAADTIKITITRDGFVEVFDNGEGVGHEDLVPAFTHLGGGKFSKGGQDGYQIRGGRNGFGPAIVNALSSSLEVRSCAGHGQVRYLRFAGQKLVRDENLVEPEAVDQGTTVRFRPDPLIFGEVAWDYDLVQSRLKDLSSINGGVGILLFWEEESSKTRCSYYSSKGLAGATEHGQPDALPARKLYFKGQRGFSEIEAAFMWSSGLYTRGGRSWVNDYPVEGGVHIVAAQRALRRIFSDLLGLTDDAGEPVALDLQAVVDTLNYTMVIRNPEATYTGQSRTNLDSEAIGEDVATVIEEQLRAWVADPGNASNLQQVLDHLRSEQDARNAARRARRSLRKADVPVGDRSLLDEVRVDLEVAREERLKALQKEHGWSDEQLASYRQLV